MGIKGSWKDPNDVSHILSPDCINVNILLAMLHSSFARCCHWKKLGQGYVGSLCMISSTFM